MTLLLAPIAQIASATTFPGLASRGSAHAEQADTRITFNFLKTQDVILPRRPITEVIAVSVLPRMCLAILASRGILILASVYKIQRRLRHPPAVAVAVAVAVAAVASSITALLTIGFGTCLMTAAKPGGRPDRWSMQVASELRSWGLRFKLLDFPHVKSRPRTSRGRLR